MVVVNTRQGKITSMNQGKITSMKPTVLMDMDGPITGFDQAYWDSVLTSPRF